MLSQYVVVLGQKYWETAKSTFSIILKLLLRHLPIPIIGKGLLRNYWRCSNANANAKLSTHAFVKPELKHSTTTEEEQILCHGWPHV